MIHCSCFSGKEYRECCEPFHKGERPERAVQLMRSRYAAYALKKIDYIMETTWNPPQDKYKWHKDLQRFSDNMIFKGLEILEEEEKGDEAWVTFRAVLAAFNGQDRSFTEKSYFKRVEGKWYYVLPSQS